MVYVLISGIHLQAEDIETVDIVVEDSGVAGGVAKDSEALSLILNPKTRSQFINELYEVSHFIL